MNELLSGVFGLFELSGKKYALFIIAESKEQIVIEISAQVASMISFHNKLNISVYKELQNLIQ